MKTVRLKPCPFCGGKATFLESTMYTNPAVVARCVNCHARTDLFIAGYDLLNERQLTTEDITMRAAQVWNSRFQAS